MKQAAQFLIRTLRNSQLYMFNFAKVKKFIAQHDLKTESKTFKATDFYSTQKNINLSRNFKKYLSHL